MGGERSSKNCCDFSFFSNCCLPMRRTRRIQPKVIGNGHLFSFYAATFHGFAVCFDLGVVWNKPMTERGKKPAQLYVVYAVNSV